MDEERARGTGSAGLVMAAEEDRGRTFISLLFRSVKTFLPLPFRGDGVGRIGEEEAPGVSLLKRGMRLRGVLGDCVGRCEERGELCGRERGEEDRGCETQSSDRESIQACAMLAGSGRRCGG